MITATEALCLPSAQLTAEEIAEVDKLEADIDTHIRETMGRNGSDFHIKGQQSTKVLAELNVRIKRAGFNTQWSEIRDQHKLNRAIQVTLGYNVHMAPTDEAYAEADEVARLNATSDLEPSAA